MEIKDKELLALLKGFLRGNNSGMAGINTRGNRQVLTYFVGVDNEDNPSGTTTNIQRIEYFDSNKLIITERFRYDINDCIIEIITE